MQRLSTDWSASDQKIICGLLGKFVDQRRADAHRPAPAAAAGRSGAVHRSVRAAGAAARLLSNRPVSVRERYPPDLRADRRDQKAEDERLHPRENSVFLSPGFVLRVPSVCHPYRRDRSHVRSDDGRRLCRRGLSSTNRLS